LSGDRLDYAAVAESLTNVLPASILVRVEASGPVIEGERKAVEEGTD
jgi:hypothetical protein